MENFLRSSDVRNLLYKGVKHNTETMKYGKIRLNGIMKKNKIDPVIIVNTKKPYQFVYINIIIKLNKNIRFDLVWLPMLNFK